MILFGSNVLIYPLQTISHRELAMLNQEAHLLEGIIAHNVKAIAGDL
jgi:hypothetical protein